MKPIEYLLVALFCAPLLCIIAASYFLNRERDADWNKPADKDDAP